MKNARFKIAKWIMLSLAVLSNTLIILLSSIDDETTKGWNNVFTAFFSNLVNQSSKDENSDIELNGIEIQLSRNEDYIYNYLPGYQVNEIPLGSAKQIDCVFDPIDATDKSISYSAIPEDVVLLNQSNSTVSVVGMKVGECLITAKSNDGGFESSVKVKVVETVAPTSYEISLTNSTIPLGTTQTIDFDIDGGVLDHNELINFRYYDTRKLTYVSSNEIVATVDSYGVVYPVSIGNTTITVSNGDYSRFIDVSVTSGSSPIPYSNLSISGSDVCYANDMILDQTSKKNRYQLTPKDGEAELNPEDFVWESSNELLVKVDKHGVMRGFRKTLVDDETAVITAKSKTTGQTASINVFVKYKAPSKMDFWFVIEGNNYVNPKEQILSVGCSVPIKINFDNNPYFRSVDAVSSDTSVVTITNEGYSLVAHAVGEGTCYLDITYKANPSLTHRVKIVSIKSGAISINNIQEFGLYIRKSLGHAAVFMVAQIFTLLAFFMFYPERKWYVYTSMSLGEGLFISGLSELIQFFIPSRSGAWLDVLIDFSGVVVGAALALLGIFIVKKIIAKRRAKQVESK